MEAEELRQSLLASIHRQFSSKSRKSKPSPGKSDFHEVMKTSPASSSSHWNRSGSVEPHLASDRSSEGALPGRLHIVDVYSLNEGFESFPIEMNSDLHESEEDEMPQWTNKKADEINLNIGQQDVSQRGQDEDVIRKKKKKKKKKAKHDMLRDETPENVQKHDKNMMTNFVEMGQVVPKEKRKKKMKEYKEEPNEEFLLEQSILVKKKKKRKKKKRRCVEELADVKAEALEESVPTKKRKKIYEEKPEADLSEIVQDCPLEEPVPSKKKKKREKKSDHDEPNIEKMAEALEESIPSKRKKRRDEKKPEDLSENVQDCQLEELIPSKKKKKKKRHQDEPEIEKPDEALEKSVPSKKKKKKKYQQEPEVEKIGSIKNGALDDCVSLKKKKKKKRDQDKCEEPSFEVLILEEAVRAKKKRKKKQYQEEPEDESLEHVEDSIPETSFPSKKKRDHEETNDDNQDQDEQLIPSKKKKKRHKNEEIEENSSETSKDNQVEDSTPSKKKKKKKRYQEETEEVIELIPSEKKEKKRCSKNETEEALPNDQVDTSNPLKKKKKKDQDNLLDIVKENQLEKVLPSKKKKKHSNGINEPQNEEERKQSDTDFLSISNINTPTKKSKKKSREQTESTINSLNEEEVPAKKRTNKEEASIDLNDIGSDFQSTEGQEQQKNQDSTIDLDVLPQKVKRKKKKKLEKEPNVKIELDSENVVEDKDDNVIMPNDQCQSIGKKNKKRKQSISIDSDAEVTKTDGQIEDSYESIKKTKKKAKANTENDAVFPDLSNAELTPTEHAQKKRLESQYQFKESPKDQNVLSRDNVMIERDLEVPKTKEQGSTQIQENLQNLQQALLGNVLQKMKKKRRKKKKKKKKAISEDTFEWGSLSRIENPTFDDCHLVENPPQEDEHLEQAIDPLCLDEHVRISKEELRSVEQTTDPLNLEEDGHDRISKREQASDPLNTEGASPWIQRIMEQGMDPLNLEDHENGRTTKREQSNDPSNTEGTSPMIQRNMEQEMDPLNLEDHENGRTTKREQPNDPSNTEGTSPMIQRNMEQGMDPLNLEDHENDRTTKREQTSDQLNTKGASPMIQRNMEQGMDPLSLDETGGTSQGNQSKVEKVIEDDRSKVTEAQSNVDHRADTSSSSINERPSLPSQKLENVNPPSSVHEAHQPTPNISPKPSDLEVSNRPSSRSEEGDSRPESPKRESNSRDPNQSMSPMIGGSSSVHETNQPTPGRSPNRSDLEVPNRPLESDVESSESEQGDTRDRCHSMSSSSCSSMSSSPRSVFLTEDERPNPPPNAVDAESDAPSESLESNLEPSQSIIPSRRVPMNVLEGYQDSSDEGPSRRQEPEWKVANGHLNQVWDRFNERLAENTQENVEVSEEEMSTFQILAEKQRRKREKKARKSSLKLYRFKSDTIFEDLLSISDSEEIPDHSMAQPTLSDVKDAKPLDAVIKLPTFKPKTYPLIIQMVNFVFQENLRLPPLNQEEQPALVARAEGSRLKKLEKRFCMFKHGFFTDVEDEIVLLRFGKLIRGLSLSAEDAQKLVLELKSFRKGGQCADRRKARSYLSSYVGLPLLHYRRLADVFQRLMFLLSRESKAGLFSAETIQKIVEFFDKHGVEKISECRKALKLNPIIGDYVIHDIYWQHRVLKSHGKKPSPWFTREESYSVLHKVMQQAKTFNVRSINSSKIKWAKVAEKMGRVPSTCLRHWETRIKPVILTHLAGEDCLDASWKLRFFKHVYNDPKIIRRSHIDYRAIAAKHFPNQTAMLLARCMDNDFYKGNRAIQEERRKAKLPPLTFKESLAVFIGRFGQSKDAKWDTYHLKHMEGIISCYEELVDSIDFEASDDEPDCLNPDTIIQSGSEDSDWSN